MRIGEQGLNPTRIECYICGKPKGIALTGLKGEQWAKKNGFRDGKMPTSISIEGDIEPCKECMERGVSLVEVESDDDRTLTKRRWLVKKEMIEKALEGMDILPGVLKKRLLVIPRKVAEQWGLPNAEDK